MLSAYLHSVLRLLANNDAILLSKLVTTISARFDVIFAGSYFALSLVTRSWEQPTVCSLDQTSRTPMPIGYPDGLVAVDHALVLIANPGPPVWLPPA